MVTDSKVFEIRKMRQDEKCRQTIGIALAFLLKKSRLVVYIFDPTVVMKRLVMKNAFVRQNHAVNN